MDGRVPPLPNRAPRRARGRRPRVGRRSRRDEGRPHPPASRSPTASRSPQATLDSVDVEIRTDDGSGWARVVGDSVNGGRRVVRQHPCARRRAARRRHRLAPAAVGHPWHRRLVTARDRASPILVQGRRSFGDHRGRRSRCRPAARPLVQQPDLTDVLAQRGVASAHARAGYSQFLPVPACPTCSGRC
jgi:hypothetical protein